MKRKFYLDLIERVIWTFMQAAGAEWLVTQTFDGKTLKIATAAGVISIIKGFVAGQFGDKDTAATLPNPDAG